MVTGGLLAPYLRRLLIRRARHIRRLAEAVDHFMPSIDLYLQRTGATISKRTRRMDRLKDSLTTLWGARHDASTPPPAPGQDDEPPRLSLAWLGGPVIGIANGVLRRVVYEKPRGDLAAHQVSTGTAIGLFGTYIYLLDRRWPVMRWSSGALGWRPPRRSNGASATTSPGRPGPRCGVTGTSPRDVCGVLPCSRWASRRRSPGRRV